MSETAHHDFLNPLCLPTTLDLYVVRRSILNALRSELPNLTGTVLDIGCGYMPYRSLVLTAPSRADNYIGLDLKNNSYLKPDLEWDGATIPLDDNAVESALATELFEHCADPELVMRETLRVLKPNGILFLTVPFLWPLHCVPRDEYRYTPFALRRHLDASGFVQAQLKPLGGWDASFAQLLGLWVRRRPMSGRTRRVLSRIALPIIRQLAARDEPSQDFGESCMLTGLYGTARKALT
jgi:SAM-dependent methyltransferase